MACHEDLLTPQKEGAQKLQFLIESRRVSNSRIACSMRIASSVAALTSHRTRAMCMRCEEVESPHEKNVKQDSCLVSLSVADRADHRKEDDARLARPPQKWSSIYEQL